MKTDLFQSCGHCWVFQFCWHIECSTFTASSFRIWNSSTGIPSPPLALLTVILPRAYLTSHSRMSGSRWVITPSWLSGSLRCLLYSSSAYSCHLLISSASVRSVPFLSFIEPIFAWNVPLGNLLEEISSLSHSIVFLYFFALITEELSYLSVLFFGILHSNGGHKQIFEGTNKTLYAPGPSRKEQWPHKRLTQTCLWVPRSLRWRRGSAVACYMIRGIECASACRRPFEGYCHYLH